MNPPTDSNTFVYWVVGIFAGVVVFLFGKLYAQITKATIDCQKDRDILRTKIDEQSTKINELAEKAIRAEALAGFPCHLPACPKLTALVKVKPASK